MYNYNTGHPICSSFTNDSLNGIQSGCHISSNTFTNTNNKERLKNMSIVKVAYKSELIVVGADRRINLTNEVTNAFQTSHIKAKYIAKYNSIISAVGLLKHNNIWWDEYCDTIIDSSIDLNSFLENIKDKLIRDSYDLELQITDYHDGSPIAYAYDIRNKRIINLSYDETNNYYSDRIFNYGSVSLGEYIGFKSPPVFLNNDYIENYVKQFIANAIRIDEYTTRELSIFQQSKPLLIGYPIDVIVIDKNGPRTTTLASSKDI